MCYKHVAVCPRQITLVLFDPYTLCFSLTRWRLNKNTFNEKFLSLSFSLIPGLRAYAENSPKRERANVTIGGHCNGRIRVSTLRYSETFYPPGRNTFDLIFFTLPPVHPSRIVAVGGAEKTGDLLCSAGTRRGLRTRTREYFDTSPTVKIEIKPRGIACACPRVEAGGIGRNSTIREAGPMIMQLVIKSNVQCAPYVRAIIRYDTRHRFIGRVYAAYYRFVDRLSVVKKISKRTAIWAEMTSHLLVSNQHASTLFYYGGVASIINEIYNHVLTTFYTHTHIYII